MINWESLGDAGNIVEVRTQRAKVPGGWLVTVSNGYSDAPSITFYPDPHHVWDGNSLS